MTVLHETFLTETSLTSSLKAASSAVSGLSQGTSRQNESSARKNPTANPMAQESYVLRYIVIIFPKSVNWGIAETLHKDRREGC